MNILRQNIIAACVVLVFGFSVLVWFGSLSVGWIAGGGGGGVGGGVERGGLELLWFVLRTYHASVLLCMGTNFNLPCLCMGQGSSLKQNIVLLVGDIKTVPSDYHVCHSNLNQSIMAISESELVW